MARSKKWEAKNTETNEYCWWSKIMTRKKREKYKTVEKQKRCKKRCKKIKQKKINEGCEWTKIMIRSRSKKKRKKKWRLEKVKSWTEDVKNQEANKEEKNEEC